MSANYLLLLLPFLLIFKTGFSAEISVFVQTGASVQLDIQTQLLESDDLSWRNDRSENIVKYTSETKNVRLRPSYKDRVDFNNKTFSLTLKNMQKTDSGLYTARASGDSDNDIITYRVSVIDAVEAPVLTVNSNWSSSDSCTVNFTCSAHELMINSTYQNNRCSSEEDTSQINTLIILYCSEESISCNHSNPVSWREDRINIKSFCADNKKIENSQLVSSSQWPVFLCGVVAVLILIICLSVFLHCKHKKGAQEQVVEDSTIYARVEGQEMQKPNSDVHTYDFPERIQAQTQKETRDKLPNTTYCTVGQHQTSTVPELEHTIYSTVCKPNKKPPASS